MDRDRGKTIRLGFKGKGEESNEEKCWREEGREGWDNALREAGGWDTNLMIRHVFFTVDRITLDTTHLIPVGKSFKRKQVIFKL